MTCVERDVKLYSLKNFEAKQFWKTMPSAANHKITNYVKMVGSVGGEEHICAI